jgi:transcription termination factor NusB
MDAVVGVVGGLAGVVIGWGLGYLQHRQQQKRAGQAAALLIMSELLHNQGRLEEIEQLESEVTDRPVRRHAWDAHAVALHEVASHDDLLALVKAYHASDNAEATSKALRQSVHDEYGELATLREQLEAAKNTGDDEKALRIANDITRRASQNLPKLKAALDEYLRHIRTDDLPLVEEAVQRVSRLTEIR